MFKDVLNTIMEDLDRISKVDKNTIYESMVKSKVDNSYNNYSSNLQINFDYLLYRDSLKVLKTIKRENLKEMRKNNV